MNAGRLVSYNAGPWKQLAGTDAVTISDGEHVAIAVCNEGNTSVSHASIRHAVLAPLVHGIGRDSNVWLIIRHSANLGVSDLLDIDGSTAKHALTSLIQGSVGEHAHIHIVIADSANIVLSRPEARVHIRGNSFKPEGTLAINDPLFTNHAANVSIDLQRVGSVTGHQGTLKIDQSYLQYAALVAPMQAGRTRTRIDQVGNVDVGRIEIVHGGVLGSLLETPFLEGANVRVSMRKSGNLNAQALVLDHAELIDEPVDTKRIHNSQIRVKMRDSGNVRVDGCVRIFESELVDETIDAPHILKSKIDVKLKRVANVTAQALSIRHGELIDEMIDSDNIDASSIRVQARQVGNVTLTDDRNFAAPSQPTTDPGTPLSKAGSPCNGKPPSALE